MKGNEVCTFEPVRVARLLVDKGYTTRYEYALQALKELPYSKWREYDPEDTVRFYALRLREAGMIRSTPQKIIAQGTDWQFLNELKKELKITRRESLNATGAVLLGVRPSPVAAAIADRLIHKGMLVRITGKSRRFETKVDPPQAA
jgi:hypothetical protein